MKHVLFVVVLLMGCALHLMGQNIIVRSAVGQQPDAFVNATLAGRGVSLFNATFNNSSRGIYTEQIGVFQANGFTGFQMDSGIVMTTGLLRVAPGPNNTAHAWWEVEDFFSDPQMELLSSGAINSCATLDFDFIGLGNSISFMYTFASEEYPEFVCSAYNDVFAFFITGPDPETGVERTWNVAIIPESQSDSTPNGVAVAINTVNPGLAGADGGGNGTDCYYDYTQYYTSNRDTAGVQYDGYTMKLTATTPILPCAVYHMHLSVCNVGDNLLDSGVFLEYGSFSSSGVQHVGFVQERIDTVRTGCRTRVPLDMSDSFYDEGMVQITFGGDAVYGRDYVCVSDSGTMMDGTTSMYVCRNVVHYLDLEGMVDVDVSTPKYIDLYLATSVCAGFPEMKVYDTLHFVMTEAGMLRVRDTLIVADYVCTEVGVSIESGQGPFTFRWMPEEGLSHPDSQVTSAFITESTIYQVEVTDRNGCSVDTGLVTVNINVPELGVDELGDEGVKVYPNPAGHTVFVEAPGLNKIEIYDAVGRKMIAVNAVNDNTAIDVSGMTNGLYFLCLYTQTGSSIRTLQVVDGVR